MWSQIIDKGFGGEGQGKKIRYVCYNVTRHYMYPISVATLAINVNLNKHNGFVIIDAGTHYINEMIPLPDDSK